VVEPCGESWEHGRGERDDASAEVEAPVDDVGELQRADLPARESVEGDERDGERGGRVGRVERGADRVGVEREGTVALVPL
jgi:hypothetical protein